MPDDLAAALTASPAAAEFFASLSFSNQRGYVSWVEETKKAETRDARVAKSISSLAAGRKVH
ncbi:MAG: YdeI/OmpD-associated family protein [Actinomycetota bacterium]|nr:YdeI/OmpD-associated family protein [Actinomycetota bacterium]